MAKKYCVIWGKNADSALRLLPIDEENFCDTPEAAKEAGRKMLVPLKVAEMMPVGVMELDEDQVEKLILSDREVHDIRKASGTFAESESDNLEFVQLAP
jgi:hypothetical protein